MFNERLRFDFRVGKQGTVYCKPISSVSAPGGIIVRDIAQWQSHPVAWSAPHRLCRSGFCAGRSRKPALLDQGPPMASRRRWVLFRRIALSGEGKRPLFLPAVYSRHCTPWSTAATARSRQSEAPV